MENPLPDFFQAGGLSEEALFGQLSDNQFYRLRALRVADVHIVQARLLVLHVETEVVQAFPDGLDELALRIEYLCFFRAGAFHAEDTIGRVGIYVDIV